AGSTAGGIKVGVFALLFFALLATLRGQDDVVALGRRVPMFVIRQALTMALLGIGALFATATLLAMVSGAPLAHILFESASALGTVGLTTGTTLEFGEAGRAILIVAMIVGRFGPLVLVLEMTRQRRRRQTVYILPED